MSSSTRAADLVAFVVDSEAIYARRSALAANNAYFRRFFRRCPDCDEVRLHHTRYVAAEAALRLCEAGQDDAFFRICRLVGESKAEVARGGHVSAMSSASAVSNRKDACREYRRRFKDVLSLTENCVLYGLDWHAGRAAQVVCAHLDEPAHLFLAVRAALSLCEPSTTDLPAQVSHALASRHTQPPPLTLLCSCLRQLVAIAPLPAPQTQKHRADDTDYQSRMDAVIAAYPVLPELLRLASGSHARAQQRKGTPSTPTQPQPPRAADADSLRGMTAPASSRPAAPAVSSQYVLERDDDDESEETTRVLRLVEQLRPIVRSLQRTVPLEAAQQTRDLAALRRRQIRELEQALTTSRLSLAESVARVDGQQRTQQALQRELTERHDAWRARCDYLEDVQIYTTALRTAAEEMERFVVSSTNELRGAQERGDAAADVSVAEACVALYEARAHALRREREIILRRIAAEEAEQEEREARISTLQSR